MFNIGMTIYAFGAMATPYMGVIKSIIDEGGILYYRIEGWCLSPNGDKMIPAIDARVYARTAAPTWEESKKAADKFFDTEVSNYLAAISGKLPEILNFPLQYSLEDPMAKKAYKIAVNDYLNTLSGDVKDE